MPDMIVESLTRRVRVQRLGGLVVWGVIRWLVVHRISLSFLRGWHLHVVAHFSLGETERRGITPQYELFASLRQNHLIGLSQTRGSARIRTTRQPYGRG